MGILAEWASTLAGAFDGHATEAAGLGIRTVERGVLWYGDRRNFVFQIVLEVRRPTLS